MLNAKEEDKQITAQHTHPFSQFHLSAESQFVV
jgi:hypothetical protein